jgi:hypothetical protein
MKYLLIAMLIVFSASCAPSVKEKPVIAKVPDEYSHLEKRFKSENADQKVRIGQMGAVFFYDKKLWSVKREASTSIDFEARRFTNASIFALNESIPMTDIYKRIAQHYNMKDPVLIDSELIFANNAVVIFNAIEGVVNRRDVSILSYGFSDDSGTIIAHCVIYKGMLRSETRQEIIEFLNGLTPKG